MKKTIKNPLSLLMMVSTLSFTSVFIISSVTKQTVFAQSPNPEACDILAYVIDPDPQGLNVRNGASTGNKILGQIIINETLQIVAALGSWVQITNVSNGFQGTGWVYAPKLGISTRGYGTNGVNLYTSTNLESSKIAKIPANANLTLLGCRGDWAQIEYQGVKGWLAREDQCGATLTICS
ncbi:MAG: SH3 domain-containing protein [Nodularia sp. CChRGM 3473]